MTTSASHFPWWPCRVGVCIQSQFNPIKINFDLYSTCSTVGMPAPVVPDEGLIVPNQPPPMCSTHIVSFWGFSACLHVKPLKKSYTNCHVHKPHLRRNKIHINTFSITEFCTEKWSSPLCNWLNLGGKKVHIHSMTRHNKSSSKCHQAIKTKHLSLKQMACTDIVYKNLNSNFIGHSVGIQPVGLCRNRWMLLLVQSLHVEMGAGTGITNWTIQDRICRRDEIF